MGARWAWGAGRPRGKRIAAAALAAWLGPWAGGAAAHEDFPKEWCGGQDCRFAEPAELNVVCGGVEVEAPEVRWTVPDRQLSTWNGDRPAICAKARKLNLCNPNKGDCTDQEGLGLLIPEAQIAGLRERMEEVCRTRSLEAYARGQSVPGLKTPLGALPATGGPGLWRVSGGGGGGGTPTTGGEENRPYLPKEPTLPETVTTDKGEIPLIPAPPALLLMAAPLAAFGWIAARRKG